MKKILFSILFMFSFMLNTYALENFQLNKEIVKTDLKYGRSVDVTLSIKSNLIKDVTKDIILVIDRSSSMNSEMVEIKKSMKTLVNNLVNDKINVGVVVYGKETISTKGLTNNLQNLNTYIDSISNILIDEGTNIEAGLKSAFDLLANSKATEKIVILLTDGEPTYYYNNGLQGDGKHYSEQGEKNARNQITLLKNNNVKVYNIGFKVTTDSKASKFLKETGDKYYNPKNISSLETDLKSVSEDINVVSINNEVIDIIPSNFKIESIPNGVKKEIVDGKTQLIWQIPKIINQKEYKITYRVVASENDYGSMYTNESAILTGNLVNEEKFKLLFNKPYAPIPMITKDDNYIEKETAKIEIDKDNGILANDSLSLNNDESKSIKNKFNVSNLSCGKNLVINIDGSFSIENDNCENISFDYSVTTYVKYDNSVEVESNLSKVNIKIIPQNNYVVKYLDIDDNKEIIDSKIVNSYLNEIVTEEYVDILNYTLVSEEKQSLSIKSENNVILFYYERNLGKYCVEYYYDNVLGKTNCIEEKIGTKIEKYPDENKNGYKVSKVENLPLIVGNNNNIKVYYSSVKESIPNTSIKNYNYSIIYILIGSFLILKKIIK